MRKVEEIVSKTTQRTRDYQVAIASSAVRFLPEVWAVVEPGLTRCHESNGLDFFGLEEEAAVRREAGIDVGL